MTMIVEPELEGVELEIIDDGFPTPRGKPC